MAYPEAMPDRWHWRELHRMKPVPIYARRSVMQGGHPAHDHDFLEIVLITGGTVVHRHAGGDERLGAGVVLLLRPGTWHAYRESAMTYWDCCVPVEALRRELAWTSADPVLGRLLWSAPHDRERGGILRLHLDAAARAEAEAHLAVMAAIPDARGPGQRATITGRFLLLAGVLATALGDAGGEADGEASAHPAVQRAIELMEAAPSRDWSLAALAAAIGCSREHLARLFSAATGLPPRAWLIRRRLEDAAGRLLRGDEPVAEIGARAGWPDANLFARRFRAQYGMSASEWRMRYRRLQ